MAVRRFDGAYDYVMFRQPAALASGACTFAALARPTTVKLASVFSQHADGGWLRRYSLFTVADGRLMLGLDGVEAASTAAGWVTAGRWRLVVLTVPAGASPNPRFHSYDFDTRTWSRAYAGALTAPVALSEGAVGIAGSDTGPRLNFAGDIAAAGVWTQELSETNVNRLLTDAWASVGPPAALVVFDQRSLSDPVVELIGGLTLTSVSGGTIVHDPPPVAAIPPTVKHKVGGVWVDRQLKRRATTWQKPAAIEVVR